MLISRREALGLLAGAAAAGVTTWPVHGQSARSHLLMVIDGLRPDYVTPEIMPRLHAMGQRGMLFEANHSIFPTVTRVNASSIATGAYPETHGLLGNTIYSEKTFPGKTIDTSQAPQLDAMTKAEGTLLTAPTLATTLQQAGKRFSIFSAGSSGAARLLGAPEGVATIVNPELFQPADLRDRLVRALGQPPEDASPNNKRNHWIVDAFLQFGLKDLKGDLTAIWFADPDETAHATGVGSPTTKQALKFVDDEIGRIEDTLRKQGLLATTNIIVTSDHGFSTHTATLKLANLVAPFSRPMPDGTPDLVVAEGAINFRAARDPMRVAMIVAALQKRPEVGAIFTRAAAPGAPTGLIAGTLSFNVARWSHARSGEILVSGNWDSEKNEFGWAGRTTQGGVAGHGTSSPFDIHNTLIMSGPDFREKATSRVPTANADLAPTLLKLMGLPVPETMTGRSIDEALKTGPDPAAVTVNETVESARAADGGYELTARISQVGKARYLNFTEVKRLADDPLPR